MFYCNKAFLMIKWVVVKVKVTSKLQFIIALEGQRIRDSLKFFKLLEIEIKF